ncbi:MAG: DNA-binding protein, partial [Planctomycetia bacterium]|nr:DNA-binding protein [Planctomycetia bacterium]
FAIDEDEVDQNAATAVGAIPALDVDDEEDDGFDEATSGEMSSGAWDVESESSGAASSSRATPSTVMAGAGPSAEWGGLWVGMLGVAALFMLVLAFVSIDLVRNLYDFRSDTPASGIVKSISGLIASS